MHSTTGEDLRWRRALTVTATILTGVFAGIGAGVVGYVAANHRRLWRRWPALSSALPELAAAFPSLVTNTRSVAEAEQVISDLVRLWSAMWAYVHDPDGWGAAADLAVGRPRPVDALLPATSWVGQSSAWRLHADGPARPVLGAGFGDDDLVYALERPDGRVVDERIIRSPGLRLMLDTVVDIHHTRTVLHL